MDEAERHADYIAVIVNGRLQCYGTPTFLQKYIGERHYPIAVSRNLVMMA